MLLRGDLSKTQKVCFMLKGSKLKADQVSSNIFCSLSNCFFPVFINSFMHIYANFLSPFSLSCEDYKAFKW